MQTVTKTSWFSRLGNSIKGIFFGFILVIGAIALLFYNEGRAVKTKKALDEGQGLVISVEADNVDTANEGNLIHLSGMLKTNDVLADDMFGITYKGVKLERVVQMYQWAESTSSSTEKKLGGGTETTTDYTYKKEWSTSLNDSSSFQESGYNNPATMAYKGAVLIADNVTLGDYTLSYHQKLRQSCFVIY